MPDKIHLDPSRPSSGRLQPMKEANGASPAPDQSVANVTNAASTSKAGDPAHQTHGAVFPTRGPITSVAQLLGKPIAKGSIGSYTTSDDYKAYLNSLTLGELHRHAVEEAKIVPIDDRNRLIRRLEGEYTAFASRSPGRKAVAHNGPKPYTDEQNVTLEALRKKMLKQ